MWDTCGELESPAIMLDFFHMPFEFKLITHTNSRVFLAIYSLGIVGASLYLDETLAVIFCFMLLFVVGFWVLCCNCFLLEKQDIECQFKHYSIC